ncbi:hypothetical protein K440DRAFT_641584 [Wilcoxina mikolae CBS 423.85]|nr:hypothetical protein K440DRAFT_642003 [Wilcoxina mikolae CBS 423.85]KAF8241660.1 hypothetical protein K440DRAFT_641584 [Wilcoxina mikolae CBS 423.85]
MSPCSPHFLCLLQCTTRNSTHNQGSQRSGATTVFRGPTSSSRPGHEFRELVNPGLRSTGLGPRTVTYGDRRIPGVVSVLLVGLTFDEFRKLTFPRKSCPGLKRSRIICPEIDSPFLGMGLPGTGRTIEMPAHNL